MLDPIELTMTELGHRFPGMRLVSSACFRYGRLKVRLRGNLDRWARLRDGSMLHVSLSEAIFRHLYFFGQYEDRVTELLLRVAQKGQVWLDIGANVGIFTMLLANRVSDAGVVHAFEPNPEMARHIRSSLKRNNISHVALHECALGSISGTCHLHLPRQPDSVEGGSGRGSLLSQRDVSDEVGLEVPLKTLDEVLKSEHRPIFGMKIDVEGYESAVLDGASTLFQEKPPLVIFAEITHLPDALLKPAELIAKFESFGYSTFRTEPFVSYNSGEKLDGGRDANMIFIHKSAPYLLQELMD